MSLDFRAGLGDVLTLQGTQHPPRQAQQHRGHTHDSSTARRGSGSAASCSWLPCSLPSRMMSQRVWEALDCLWKDRKPGHTLAEPACHAVGWPLPGSLQDAGLSLTLFISETPALLSLCLGTDLLRLSAARNHPQELQGLSMAKGTSQGLLRPLGPCGAAAQVTTLPMWYLK